MSGKMVDGGEEYKKGLKFDPSNVRDLQETQ